MVGWCLTALSAQIGYIVLCPARKVILQHSYHRQMAEPGFEPWSFCYQSKYCNYSATEADLLYKWYLSWTYVCQLSTVISESTSMQKWTYWSLSVACRHPCIGRTSQCRWPSVLNDYIELLQLHYPVTSELQQSRSYQSLQHALTESIRDHRLH